jgi:predicted neuraminidase
VNRQISKLAVASLVLVISLIVGTTYWQAWAAPSLADRRDNAIKVVAQFTIKRGGISRRCSTPRSTGSAAPRSKATT